MLVNLNVFWTDRANLVRVPLNFILQGQVVAFAMGLHRDLRRFALIKSFVKRLHGPPMCYLIDSLIFII
jgi:hypothetical protein